VGVREARGFAAYGRPILVGESLNQPPRPPTTYLLPSLRSPLQKLGFNSFFPGPVMSGNGGEDNPLGGAPKETSQCSPDDWVSADDRDARDRDTKAREMS
jgi:hypothetical protein